MIEIGVLTASGLMIFLGFAVSYENTAYSRALGFFTTLIGFSAAVVTIAKLTGKL